MPRISIRQFMAAIRRLKADRPKLQSGVWYKTQKEHWLGWLAEYNSRGYYGRVAGRNRDACYAYNHIVEAKMLAWLGSAAGVSPAVMRRVRAMQRSGEMMQRQSEAIRRAMPWKLVARAIWPRRDNRAYSQERCAMNCDPIYTTTGDETEKIDIPLSYRIIRLFSECLSASSNKAIEELVANGIDGIRSRQSVSLRFR